MSSPSDPFDSVRSLLRLKRYEQPPPRYFDEFSAGVLARIERGEARGSWWERFGFDLRPALAAATGAFACALVIYGVATADDVSPVDTASTSALGSSAIPDSFTAASGNSTNPVSTYGTPIDREVFRAQLTPASFSFR
jgi:hypothetical protein